MKRLLLALLFANVAFFGYAHLVGDASPPPPPPAPSIPRLALLGEGAPPAGRCQTVGPFAERAVLEQASAWLHGAHYDFQERERQTDGPVDYVVTAAAPTLKQAEQTIMRLKAAGVGDLGVVAPTAEHPTALIQLGLYTERAHAEQRMADLRRYALSAVITEQPHRVTDWWLDVALAAKQSPVDATALSKAVGGAEGVSVEPCAGSAPRAAPPGTAPVPNEPPAGAPPAKLSDSSPA